MIDNGGTYETTFYISGFLLIASSLLTLVSTFWRKDFGDQKTYEYDIPAEEQSKKNSTFLTQSGLLAGSIIIQADEKIGSVSSLNLRLAHAQKRFPNEPGLRDSEESLFKNVMRHHLQTSRDERNSQYSLFKDPNSATNDAEFTIHIREIDE